MYGTKNYSAILHFLVDSPNMARGTPKPEDFFGTFCIPMVLSNDQKNKWYKLRNQNLAVFMREAGFDISVYGNYSKDVQKEAKKRSIRNAIDSLRREFERQTDVGLNEVRRGVYVIRIAGGMSVRYRDGKSPVLYIGQGNLENRIKGHYDGKLFDFMLSLNGANFDFYVCEPWKSHYRGNDFHKQVEFNMIEDFAAHFGGVDEQHRFPLMNKIAGSDRGLEISSDWWRTPLKRSGNKTNWILEPGPHSQFAGALD